MRDLRFEQRWLVVDVNTDHDLRQWEGVHQVCDTERAATFMRIGDRRFDLVGGVRVDSAFLQRFAREEGLVVSLVTPTDTLFSRTKQAVPVIPS